MSYTGHDDFSRSPVIDFTLRPWWYLLIIEMGVMISVPIFIIGAQLGLSLSLKDLILCTFGGASIVGLLGGLTARLGAITRCSCALIAQSTFGKRGMRFSVLLMVIAMTGWWGVQTELFGIAAARLIYTMFHFNVSPNITVLLGGVAMIITAALGIRAIGKLAYLAVPLLSMGMSYAVLHIFKEGAFNVLLTYHPINSTLSPGTAVSMVAGGFIVGALMNPDIARFALNKYHAVGYAVTDYAFVYPLLLILSGILGIWYKSSDVIIHFAPQGFTWLVLLMIMFATWAANDCNLYSSSLSLATLIHKVERSHLAIAAGSVGILLAELHIASHMVSFLTILGVLIAPVAGVFIMNAVGRKDAITSEELASTPDWCGQQLFAWLCGAVAGWLTTPRDTLGYGLFKITSISPLDAVLTAAVIMAIIRFMKGKLLASQRDAKRANANAAVADSPPIISI